MALISHTNVSYNTRFEMVQCKNGHGIVLNMGNSMEASKPKEICFGSSSVSCNSVVRKITHLGGSVGVACKRGYRVIVAVSPPTEDAVIATEPLTKEDLVGYLASGCKPKEKWRIGTEHEKFGFEIGTLRPMSYEQIAELLNSIAERFDWDKVMEGDNIIGFKQGKQRKSLEPGGQFELSGAPLETLHQTCAEISEQELRHINECEMQLLRVDHLHFLHHHYH